MNNGDDLVHTSLLFDVIGKRTSPSHMFNRRITFAWSVQAFFHMACRERQVICADAMQQLAPSSRSVVNEENKEEEEVEHHQPVERMSTSHFSLSLASVSFQSVVNHTFVHTRVQ